MHRPSVAVVALSLAAAACTAGIEEGAEALGSSSVTPSASTSVAPSAGSIVVRAPRPDDDVISPVVINGTASTANGEVLVQVLDGDGIELAAMDVPIDCGAGCRGVFRAELVFFAPSPQPGAVQVLEIGPGGSAVHLVEVPVRIVGGV